MKRRTALYVTDGTGVTNSRYVPLYDQERKPAVIDFEATPTTALVGEDVAFSFTGDWGSHWRYKHQAQWDFGDNVTQWNPYGADTHSHAYAEPGIYHVVWTALWTTETWETDIVVVLPNTAPTPAFDTATQGVVAHFTDASTDSDGEVRAWHWDFGDGTNSTDPSPSHRYAPGTYTVVLTVTDDDGATAMASRQVTLPAPA